jgi:hypothetical protein
LLALTLLARSYSGLQRGEAERSLKSKLRGLNAEPKIVGTAHGRWIQLEVKGEDEKVAVRYLADEIGLCPASLEYVERFSSVKGYIAPVERGRQDLQVDIGVFSPNTVHTSISLQGLQAQLVDGRKIAVQKITELFGLCENLPLIVKVVNIDMDRHIVQAMLSEKQVAQYRIWLKSLLDRLIVIGASEYAVNMSLRKAGLQRDVVGVQPLGLFEHALTCKLGTDAAGLIPRMGRILRNATFSVFSPRRILDFLGYSTALVFDN